MSRDRGLPNVRRSGASRAASRRERERRDRRNERLLIYCTIAVLSVAAVIVVVGLYITQYRPPRAHVLTLGDRDYNAGAIVDRAVYEVLVGGVTPTTDAVLPQTLQRMEDQAVVLAAAPAEVGEVTDDDIDAELRERLGFTDSEDQEGYGEALATLLRATGLPRSEYNRIVSQQILLERLSDGFREEIGETADQVNVSRIRLASQSEAEEVRTQLLDGADFAALATELTVEVTRSASGGEIGWLPDALLSEAARPALADLEPGAISEVVQDGGFFDVYLVSEREEARALEETQIDQLVALRRTEWIDEHRDAVNIERDLSDGESKWIVDRIVDRLRP